MKDVAGFVANAAHSIAWKPTVDESRKKCNQILNIVILVERDCSLFLACSGLRVGEALPLEKTAVDRVEGIIHVCREKNGINPWVPILPEMETLLDEMESRGRQGRFLFPSAMDPDRPLPYPTLLHRLEKTCERLGIKHVTPHGFRSFFVTACREAGLPDTEVAALIGDKSGASIIATTYGDVRPEHLHNQARRVRLLLRPPLQAAQSSTSKVA